MNRKEAFTLVELIVVVTILAILATIGFVSYSSYLVGVRDSNRAAQLVSINNGLELYRTKNFLPIPDDNIEVKYGIDVIGYQGSAGLNTLETIDFTKGGTDPKTKEYFNYYLTKDKKDFQLMAFFEDEVSTERISSVNIDSNLVADVNGRNLGILVDETNTPINKIPGLISSGLDISDVGATEYTAYLKNGYAITGTGTTLGVLKTLMHQGGSSYTCKDILETGASTGDGTYKLVSGGILFGAYCDMTNDGGGWTLIDGLGDRFGGTVVINNTSPNIDNYNMPINELESLIPFINEPTFRYTIEANSESLELFGQIYSIDTPIQVSNYGTSKTRSTSWITMNSSIDIQTEHSSNYTRFNLRGTEISWPSGGHMKFYDEAHGPHTWWMNQDGSIGGLYLNGTILSTPISSLPTFGGLFSWFQYSVNRFELHASGTNDMNYSTDSNLLGQIEAGLYVK